MHGLVCRGWLLSIVLFAALPAVTQAKLVLTSAVATAEPPVAPDVATHAAGEVSTAPQLPVLTSEQRGDIHMARGAYQAALRDYAAVTQPSAALWNKMGIAYQMLFDIDDSAKCYKEALKLEPGNFRALNNLATVQDALHDFGAAERNYKKALRLDPRDPKILKNLGTNLLMQHEYGRGSDAYAEALAINPHVFDPSTGPSIDEPAPKIEHGTESYFQAETCARARLTDCAISHLRAAFSEGSATFKRVVNDYDFSNLQGDPEFDRLLAEHNEHK